MNDFILLHLVCMKRAWCGFFHLFFVVLNALAGACTIFYISFPFPPTPTTCSSFFSSPHFLASLRLGFLFLCFHHILNCIVGLFSAQELPAYLGTMLGLGGALRCSFEYPQRSSVFWCGTEGCI
ncbi:hypothetical protein HOY82DRAFT_346922 [Tuber indicum]|nr:hypothetical protein HOY82DRAFT_346922 [Tuber indicum]